MLYITGSELSESNEVGVKHGFILRLKKLLLLKSISQFIEKETNKQTNKQRKRKRKQAYARVDLDLDDENHLEGGGE